MWELVKQRAIYLDIILIFLPITRQAQIAGKLPTKSYASISYSDKKQLEFVLDLTANVYSSYSTMEICLPLKFTKKSNKVLQMDA